MKISAPTCIIDTQMIFANGWMLCFVKQKERTHFNLKFCQSFILKFILCSETILLPLLHFCKFYRRPLVFFYMYVAFKDWHYYTDCTQVENVTILLNETMCGHIDLFNKAFAAPMPKGRISKRSCFVIKNYWF